MIKNMVKEMPDDWHLAKYYFPNIDLKNCKIYEIIFSRLSKDQCIKVKINVPDYFKNKNCNLFYTDGKGNFKVVNTIKMGQELYFSTNKVGLYILIEEKEMTNDNKISQLIMTATNMTKNIYLKVERTFLGM